MNEIVDITTFNVVAVKVDRGGGHGGVATLTLSRPGFHDQLLHVEPEEGERIQTLMKGSNTLTLHMRRPRDYSKPPNARLPSCS